MVWLTIGSFLVGSLGDLGSYVERVRAVAERRRHGRSFIQAPRCHDEATTGQRVFPMPSVFMVPAEGLEATAGSKPCCAKMRDDRINIGDNAAFVNSDDFANSAGIRTKTRECCHNTATTNPAPQMACPGLSTNSDGQTPADRSPRSLRIDRPGPTEPTGLDGELIGPRLHPQFPWGLPHIGSAIPHPRHPAQHAAAEASERRVERG